MYISLEWLKDFIKIPAKIKPADLAAELTKHTVEVENVVNQAAQFSGVVVGRVLEVKPHPNADRLRLTVVDVKKAQLKIVCGAPNIAAGQLVPVALAGTTLPGGLEIKEAEIRGVASQGMICAEDELGLGKGHAGIMVLDARAKIGEPFAKYLKAEDAILEIDNKSLSNRPDLFSHYGIAREFSVIFNMALKPYDKFLVKADFPASGEKLDVRVEDKEACPRYQALRVDNIAVTQSPAWLKERLVAVGQRPINNIVDLTNYVMLETGQPLHAFDAGKVSKISVRRAGEHETITTLDGQERILDTDDLVIVSEGGAVALAGIMGGLDSGVTETTKALVLEAANFKATVIRRSSKKLGLRSESSLRFEKSLDPTLTLAAIRRFIMLLKKVCPEAKVASSLVDIGGAPTALPVVSLDLDWLNVKLGSVIPRTQVISILTRLGFNFTDTGTETLAVTIPSWRATKDISGKEDLAEEVLRFYGYDAIVSQLPTQALFLPEINFERALARRVKDLVAHKYALVEMYNYSFVGEDQLTRLNIDFSQHLRIANPVSELFGLLRRSLAPGLIANIKNNQAKAAALGFFEIGSIFSNTPGSIKKEAASDATLPYQEQRLAMALADDEADLFGRTKAVVADLLRNIFGPDREIEFSLLSDGPGWAEATLSAKVLLNGKEIGLVARLSAAAQQAVNIKKVVAIAELDFSLLAELAGTAAPVRWREGPKYPAVRRDLAVVVGAEVLYNELRKVILNFNPLLRSAELFDVYSGELLPDGRRSLAFHLEFQSEERTLTAAEVDAIEKGLVANLDEKFVAKLRDF